MEILRVCKLYYIIKERSKFAIYFNLINHFQKKFMNIVSGLNLVLRSANEWRRYIAKFESALW